MLEQDPETAAQLSAFAAGRYERHGYGRTAALGGLRRSNGL